MNDYICMDLFNTVDIGKKMVKASTISHPLFSGRCRNSRFLTKVIKCLRVTFCLLEAQVMWSDWHYFPLHGQGCFVTTAAWWSYDVFLYLVHASVRTLGSLFPMEARALICMGVLFVFVIEQVACLWMESTEFSKYHALGKHICFLSSSVDDDDDDGYFVWN